MPNYIPTIGLEVHVELKTQTKMFCGSLNDPLEKRPNVNVCSVCLGHPGTLPVPNKAAIEAILKVGMALHGDIPAASKFDRKNYFYPDLPKGYQISQYDVPLVFGGILQGVRLTRIHLEEDTARLVHGTNLADEHGTNAELRGTNQRLSASHQRTSASLVDFNRAGVPLMELVTEPDVTDAEQAVAFARELQLILRYLGVSDADMEKGQMRVEANVSIRRATPIKTQMNAENPGESASSPRTSALGTKVEVKNLNSFRAVQGAIEYEVKRQTEVLESGGVVRQETRGWDDGKRVTVSQRAKESAHDYRYFPEPDIPELDLSRFDLTGLKRSIPELPQEKRVRFGKEFGLKPEQVEVLVGDRGAAEFFEEAISELATEDNAHLEAEQQLLFNYLTSDLRGLMLEAGTTFTDLKVTPEHFADLIELISHSKVSSRSAKDILKRMMETGADPHEILKSENLEQVSDEAALTTIVQKILGAHPAAVADYRKGKMNALQFLVGKAMAELKGKGNPGMLQELFKKTLESVQK